MLKKKRKPPQIENDFSNLIMKGQSSSNLTTLLNETEKKKHSLSTQDSKQSIIEASTSYPYYSTLKKIMYAFGDCYHCKDEAVIHMHDFISNFIAHLNSILTHCDYKKIVNHFFSYEHEKLHNYKKLQMKNRIITGQTYRFEANAREDKLNSNDVDFDENIFISDDDSVQLVLTNKGNDKQQFDEDERDEDYNESISFQSERTEKMSTEEYLEYCDCRQCGFLSLGHKHFVEFLLTTCTKCCEELKGESNSELIAFILKEKVKNIVTEAIKAKHPQQKLFILSSPLSKEDVAPLCLEELSKLTDFLNDFNTDPSLNKAFKKRLNLNRKAGNKNVKIKHTDKGLFVIIKKYILLDNVNELEQFKTMKLNAEVQALNAFLLLRDKCVLILNERAKCKSTPFNEPDYVKLNFTGINATVITIRDLIDYLGIDNYYEYFLVKDYLFEIDLKEMKTTGIEKKVKMLSKVRLKTVADKFGSWLKLTKQEQGEVIDEFNSLVKTKEAE